MPKDTPAPAPTATEACWNCNYFSYLPNNDMYGYCREQSPTPSTRGVSEWPIVLNVDWCGKWAAMTTGVTRGGPRPTP